MSSVSRELLRQSWLGHDENRVAVIAEGDCRITYGVLYSCVKDLLLVLAPYSGRIGLVLDRSIEALIVALACLQSDRFSFVPLSDNPDESVIKQAQLSLIIAPSDTILPSTLPRATLAFNDSRIMFDISSKPSPSFTSEDECCYLFTSGSTRASTGFSITWRGLRNRLSWMWGSYPFSPDSRLAWSTPLVFVDSLSQIFGAVVAGAALIIIPSSVSTDLLSLNDILCNRRITHYVTIPSVLRALIRTVWNDPMIRVRSLQQIVSSAEPLDTTLALSLRYLFPRATLLNLYGCTEATGDSLYYEWSRACRVPESLDDSDLARYADWAAPLVPIGRPIPGNIVRLSDENEIIILGQQVNRGDIHTADIAYQDNDGLFHYIGRASRQVKSHGIWISLDRIEAHLHAHHRVRRAAVVMSDDNVLVGIVEVSAVTSTELRSWCAAALKPEEIPHSWITVSNLPKTPSGKIDLERIQKLTKSPDPVLEEMSSKAVCRAVLCNILGIETIGDDEPIVTRFGLDSLSATLACNIIGRRLNCTLKPAHFAAYPTVSALSAFIDSDVRSAKRTRHDVGIVEHWAVDTGGCVDSTPIAVVVDNRTVIVTASHSGAIIAAELDSGDLIYTMTLPTRFETPLIAHQDRIVACGRNGFVYGLDMKDGTLCWQFKFQMQVKSRPIPFNESSLALSCYDGYTYIIQIQDDVAQLAETFKGDGPLRAAPAFCHESNILVVASLGTTATAYAKVVGSPVKRMWIVNVGQSVFADPIIVGDSVIIVTARGDLFCIGIEDCKQIWRIYLRSQVFSTPVQSGNALLIATQSRGLLCYRMYGRRRQWVWLPPNKEQLQSSPVVLSVDDGTLIYLCSTSGMIWVLKTDAELKQPPSIVAEYKLPGESFATPVIVDDKILIGCRDDHVHCLQLTNQKGSPRAAS